MSEEKLTESIALRASPKLKEAIERQAMLERRKTSDWVRLILEQALNPSSKPSNGRGLSAELGEAGDPL